MGFLSCLQWACVFNGPVSSMLCLKIITAIMCSSRTHPISLSPHLNSLIPQTSAETQGHLSQSQGTSERRKTVKQETSADTIVASQ